MTDRTDHSRIPGSPLQLDEAIRRLTGEARDATDGRAAMALTPGLGGGSATQTLVCIAQGASLGSSSWNGPASLLVLRGTAMIGGDDTPLSAGTWLWLEGPAADIRAKVDVAGLLTVFDPS